MIHQVLDFLTWNISYNYGHSFLVKAAKVSWALNMSLTWNLITSQKNNGYLEIQTWKHILLEAI